MKNKKQSGFAVIETLLIFIIITVIGGTGYYVWHTKNQTDNSLNKTAAISQNNINTVQKPTVINSGDTLVDGYLNIKEWGVRLKITSQISDIYYTISGSDALLDLKSLDSLKTKDGAQCQSDKNSVVMISKFTPSAYQSYLQSSGYEDTAVRIGDYDYLTTIADSPVPSCSYKSDGSEAAGVNDKIQAEISAAGTIEAIPH